MNRLRQDMEQASILHQTQVINKCFKERLELSELTVISDIHFHAYIRSVVCIGRFGQKFIIIAFDMTYKNNTNAYFTYIVFTPIAFTRINKQWSKKDFLLQLTSLKKKQADTVQTLANDVEAANKLKQK